MKKNLILMSMLLVVLLTACSRAGAPEQIATYSMEKPIAVRAVEGDDAYKAMSRKIAPGVLDIELRFHTVIAQEVMAHHRAMLVNRRGELGQLMMESEYLDKMIVNRVWAHFLGHAFTKPMDDLGPRAAYPFGIHQSIPRRTSEPLS